MICMAYISSAKLGLKEGEIIGIVEDAQINNQKIQVTGLLLFNNGNFMQVVEGESENVEPLYEKIRKDNRHTDVTLLIKEQITHRNFSNWTMGFRNLETLKKINPEILNPFLEDELNFAIYQHNPYRALHFLETFKKIIV